VKKSIVRGRVILAGAALVAAGCARGDGVAAGPSAPSASIPSAAGWTRPETPLTPRTANWDQFFQVDWNVVRRGAQPVVEGRVRNDWGFPANQIQLLVDALDADGRVVAQRVTRLGANELPPGIAAPFSVSAPPAAGYRVSVYAFNWIQGGGDHVR
jgi:hypothetical protein